MVTQTAEVGGIQGNDIPLSLEGSEISGAAVLLLNGVREGDHAAAAQEAAPAVAGEILVGFRPGTMAAQVAAIAAAHGATVKQRIGGQDYLLGVAPGAAGTVSAALRRAPAVQHAEPNFVVVGENAPNDPAYQICPPDGDPNDPAYQDCPYTVWAPHWINAEPAWAITTGSPNVIVAVLDSGISYSHPEFDGRVLQGWDFYNLDNAAGGNYAQDDFGHGTHVSGIIGAAINNNLGMVGIAPNVKIMPVKVLSATGSGDAGKVASGIYYAVDNGAKIINLSLGSTASSTTMLNALRYAVQNNVLLTCAAGNNGSNVNFYPAAYPECFGVSGTMEEDAWYTLSNWGAWVDISAPASSIYSTLWTSSNANTFLWKDGTSQATPHVAGLAALLLSVNPNLKPGDLRAIIQQSAVDLGAAGWDDHFGAGRINVGAAVTLAQGWTPYTPTPGATATPAPTQTSTRTSTPTAIAPPTSTSTSTEHTAARADQHGHSHRHADAVADADTDPHADGYAGADEHCHQCANATADEHTGALCARGGRGEHHDVPFALRWTLCGRQGVCGRLMGLRQRQRQVVHHGRVRHHRRCALPEAAPGDDLLQVHGASRPIQRDASLR